VWIQTHPTPIHLPFPQGAYFNFTRFIEDQKLPTGKRGYSKEYPPLYVLRPDGSTLYTFRDVVYSFKKASQCDLVLNIICRCVRPSHPHPLHNSDLRFCGPLGTADTP